MLFLLGYLVPGTKKEHQFPSSLSIICLFLPEVKGISIEEENVRRGNNVVSGTAITTVPDTTMKRGDVQ
ncbi:hypothetical protein SAMN05428981_10751 [Bacillus sp. OV194]|nr:hypothetical protein SAMN05428981_10751 [Bacillus sp. OV194]